MKLSSLGLPPEFLSIYANKDLDLYQHQIEAIEAIRKGKNVVVSVPTASGKTLIAYVTIFDTFLSGRKSIYVVPLKALASEKYNELKKLSAYGLRVRVASGDYDEGFDIIRRSDVLIATSEKVDSMIRHDPFALLDVGLVVFDETHLIGSENRGPVMEFLITTVKHVNPDASLLCLSATLPNHEQFARWIGGVSVVSDFRPVPLVRGIIHGKGIEYDDGSVEEFSETDPVLGISVRHIKEGGQALIFVNSRRRAEEFSKSYAGKLNFGGSKISTRELEEQDIYDEILSSVISRGVSFHHAGLSGKQRNLIESLFVEGKIKILFATPTLASGVNLPARLVVVRDITRYSGGYSHFIPDIEINQMVGRAGRPGFDTKGYALIYASSERSREIAEEVLYSPPHPIMSMIGSPSFLRKMVLSLISTEIARNSDEILKFLSGTFYALQHGPRFFSDNIGETIEFLIDNEFVRQSGERLVATQFGKLTSELYIDPVTSLILREFLNKRYSVDSALFHICKVPDMLPIPYRKSDYASVNAFLMNIDEEIETDEDLNAAKTAVVLHDWINEVPLRVIEHKYAIGYGDLQSRTSSADWISYSLSRLSRKFKPEVHLQLENLNFRIKEGVREDVIALTLIRGIGRVRARRLYENGFRSIESIANASEASISSIYGFSQRLAKSIIMTAKKQRGRFS